MALSPRDKLDPYEILAPIWQGPEWAKCIAPATRHETSTAQFTECFECEARAVAGLNHPNICTRYGVGPGLRYLMY